MRNKLIYLFLLLISATACNDFTESTAYGALSDEQLQNAQGVELKLIGAYSLLDGMSQTGGADWYKTGDNWWLDVISDDAHKGSTDGDQADLFLLETFDWTSTNPYIAGRWRSLFAGVNRANAVIDLINQIPEGDFTQQMAEARFLRAIYNLDIQRMWGNVPYISEENYANTEFNQPNPGPIWDKIEADFQFAVDNLAETQDDVGRPTSWAAMAFLGKTYLYQGKYPEALEILDDVIADGPYSLLDEYVDNFRLAGDNSSESIFAIQFTADDGQSYNGNRGGTLNFPGGGPFNSCCGFYQPTQDLVNAFQTQGGLPLLDTYNQSDVANDYGLDSYKKDENGNIIEDEDGNPVPTDFAPHNGPLDPRLDYTVGRRSIDYNGWGVMPGKVWIRASFADISGPYLPKKNIYYAGEDANMGTGGWGQQRSGINYHIMRFPDVLLMAAEAAVETGDLTKALTYVNRVRARAKNMSYVKDLDDPNQDAANYEIELYASFPDADYARKAVRFERRLELGMEGQRLFDIRRWGNGVQVMNDYIANEARTITPFGNAANPYQDKHNLLPIPLGAIDLSGGVLTQNPGY